MFGKREVGRRGILAATVTPNLYRRAVLPADAPFLQLMAVRDQLIRARLGRLAMLDVTLDLLRLR
jgi:hypothetical protein